MSQEVALFRSFGFIGRDEGSQRLLSAHVWIMIIGDTIFSASNDAIHGVEFSIL